MSVSGVLNRWLKRLYKVLAILLVTFAVAISLLRLFLPYAQNYRQDVEDYLNRNFQAEIAIGELAMGWEKSGPSLVVKNVTLFKSKTANIFIDRFEVEVNFWRTLSTRKLVTQDVVISGADIVLDNMQSAETELIVENEAQQSQSLTELIEAIFLEQIARFSITNSHIFITTNSGDREFSIEQIAWMNEAGRHRAEGTITLDGLSSNHITLLLDLHGQEIASLSGQAYLSAQQINITPWLDTMLALPDENTHSAINFQTWLEIDNGQAKSAQIALGESEIRWNYQQRDERFAITSGDIFIVANGKGNYSLTSTPLVIKRNEAAAESLLLQSKHDHTATEIYISALNLASFQGIFPLLSNDVELEQLLAQMAPEGYLEDVHIMQQAQTFAIAANYRDVAINYSAGIPGLSHLSGDILFVDDQFFATLIASDGEIDFDKHFLYKIPYQTIHANVSARFADEKWQLDARDVQLSSEQLALTADVRVEGGKNIDASMSLLASVSRGDAKFAPYYYPHLLMGQDLVDYLTTAIVDGNVEQAQVLFNGPFKAFPFNDHEGIFVVDAELSNSTFVFDEEWPAIENFAANLNFTNNSMLITGRSGQLRGIDVTGVEAAIVDLSDQQVLTVDAKFTDVAPELVRELMHASPMRDSVGVTLDEVSVTKSIAGSFSLNLPLNEPEKVVAKGEVNFVNNLVQLKNPELIFTEVNGLLSYHNDVIAVDGLTLNWRGMPVTINADSQQQAQHYSVDIETIAHWQMPAWQAQVPTKLQPYAAGMLDWQGKLNIAITEQAFNYDYRIHSSLDEINLLLPEPFDKQATTSLPVKIHAYGDALTSTIDADIGDNINFYGELDHQSIHFSLAHLVLGKPQFWLPTQGFHITADLDKANYQQWQPLVLGILDSIDVLSETDEVSNNAASEQTEHLPLLSAPARINGRINTLTAFEHNFDELNFEFTKQKNWYLLDANAQQARGKVKFFPNWHEQGLEIEADFIHLAALTEPEAIATSNVEQQEQITLADQELAPQSMSDNAANHNYVSENDTLNKVSKAPVTVIDHLANAEFFKNVPMLKVKCASCKYGVYNFGEVSFSVDRANENTLNISKFTAKRGKTLLAFDLNWQLADNLSTTQLVGRFVANDVERELEQLGYASTIKDSGVVVDYDLNWQGAPYNFAVRSLNGDIAANFDDGYLADVDDKGVRILSILSLQSLVRKLSFDFRDIFSDGMFYSDLKGKFTIDNGIAYTDNFKMKGTAGDLTIVGNTDLNTEALDYKMSYKPNLTSSLPVLAWIATLNPVTFLAGVALDEVITSTVIAEINFEVGGTLDEPLMKQVSRKNQNISVGRSTPPKIVENQQQSSGTDQQPSKPPQQENKFDGS